MSNDNSDAPDDYDVGYAKPPRQHRFKPGQSGNPKGRQRGSRNMRTMLQELLENKVTMTLNGETREMPFKQAFLMQLAASASKGSVRDRELFLELIRTMTPEELMEAERSLPTPDEKLLLDRFATRAAALTEAENDNAPEALAGKRGDRK